MNFVEILKEASAKKATDVYLITGAVPCINVEGHFSVPTTARNKRLSPQALEVFAKSVMSTAHWDELNDKCELNIAFMDPDIGRFRVNALWQRGSLGLVMRRVEMNIPTLKELGLPIVMRNVSLADRGIVLVCGSTGSGKSTTMASVLDYRNHLRSGHIVTIEDPIEFVYRHRRSIVTQREVGLDTHSFEEALKNSLRQAPQVISIGELRTAETVQFAMHAAETGHLVFATLHSTNAVAALERVMHFYPSSMERQVLSQLSLNLRTIICQRLIPNLEGGRSCATEVFMNNPRIQELIARGELGELKQYINEINHQDGTISFDKSLYILAKQGKISEQNALKYAESENDLSLKFKGMGLSHEWENVENPWDSIEDPYSLPTDYSGLPGAGYNNEDARDMMSKEDIRIPVFKDILMQSRRTAPKAAAPPPPANVQQHAPAAERPQQPQTGQPDSYEPTDEPSTEKIAFTELHKEESSSHAVPKKNYASQQRVPTEFPLEEDERWSSYQTQKPLSNANLPQEFPPRPKKMPQTVIIPGPGDKMKQLVQNRPPQDEDPQQPPKPQALPEKGGKPGDVVNRYRDMIKQGLPDSVAEDLDSEFDMD